MPVPRSLSTLQRSSSHRLAGLAVATTLAWSGAALALPFEVVALSGHTALPFSSGSSTTYGFNLRQATIAGDGWVGFASGQGSGPAAAFMIGVPGQVLAAAQAGSTVDGQPLGTLRQQRVDSGRRVSFTASTSGSITLHYGSDNLASQPAQRVASSGLVYNRSTSPNGPISFELLAGGARLVNAATSNGSTYETGWLDAAGTYRATVQSNSTSSRTLPTLGVPGVGNAAAGRTLSSALTVGGDGAGLSFVYGLQSGNGLMIDGAQVRSNLIEVRPDGTRRSILHPGSTVPGTSRPSQGINPTTAQFASGGNTLALRADFGRNTTDERKLMGAILRYDAGTDPADNRLQVVAMPGSTVPGLVSSSGTAVSFGHKVGVDGSGTLAPLSMLPDNLVEDAARGMAVNAGGTLAFVSAVTAAPASAGYGVFLQGADGSFVTLASSATITAGLAPETESTFAKFHDVAINDHGLVVFSATLTGADGRQGYWYGQDAGNLQLLVLEGQTLEVLPGVFKTVGNLSTSLHELDDTRITALDDGLGNDGHFAFSVVFTDGSEAVLRTPLAPVPEPGTALLMVAGLAFAAYTARRRARP